MMHRIDRAGAVAAIALCGFASGCSGNRPVQTEVLLNHHNCQTLSAGVTEVAVTQIAKIRGSRLLLEPGKNKPANAQDAQDAAALSSATRVFAISKGRMPTPGYGFALDSAELSESTLTLALGWQQPAADAVLSQVTTHPCMVVAVPVSEVNTLVVRDHTGELGRLAL